MSITNKPDSTLQVIENGTVTHACWSCGDMRAAHFCDSCGRLQPAVPTDYFTFFGLSRKLNLDVEALEREFYHLSRKLHPDIYARATGQEQQWSLEKSSQLNDAYRTLRDPIARTQYLLKLEGVHLEEQSKAATDKARQSGQEKKQVIPPELLEEVFELNMQLEEARMNRKMGERDPELLRQMEGTRNELQAKDSALMDELRGYWNDWDALPENAMSNDAQRKAVIDRMVALLNRRSYIRNLVRDVNEVLED
jgi:molecular chaperone HscB